MWRDKTGWLVNVHVAVGVAEVANKWAPVIANNINVR